MMSGRPSSVAARKNQVLVSLVIAASAIAFLSYNFLSSELAGKSKIIEQQDREILQYADTVAAQQEAIAQKTERLAELNSEIDALST